MKKLILSLFIFLCVAASAIAQERTVTGTVTAREDNLPIPGVSVRVKEVPGAGTQTSSDGKFTLRVPAGGKTLVFSYIGYATIDQAIGNGPMRVALTADATSLNEIVITGAGLQVSKRTLGASQTTLKGESLTQAKPTTVAAGLTGKVAGLNIQGTSGGVNPNYRVILRGMRSLTGNNEALIVVDNTIVPNAILGNLNPEDIEDVTVLNGASSAALYGSAASNGALIITTKKGRRTPGLDITVDHTTTVEKVAFFPGLQKQFGSGSDNDIQIYNPIENQQYGPAFDGVVREIGRPLEDGSIQQVPYAWTNSKNEFWETGLTNQTNFSASSGSEAGSMLVSAQYLQSTGTTPGDKYNRATARVGGTRQLNKQLDFTYSSYYAQNRYDQTTETSNIYNYLLNAPGNAPLTNYSDWRNDPFANPNGYFNAYYNNPYFMADNYRKKSRNDYFIGNAELKFKPLDWLDFTGRVGLTTRNQTSKQFSDVFVFSDYTKSIVGSSEYKRQDILGNNTDESFYNTTIISDFIVHAQKKISDFKFDLTGLAQLRQDQYKIETAGVTGLLTPGLFNLGNSLNPPTASGKDAMYRSYGLSGKFDVAFKDYLYLTVTGRNDWVSILSPKNRSFFYPSVSLSFIPTDAFAVLKEIDQIDFIKVRGSWSKVGQVNLQNATTFGAYSLLPIFSQGSGYPYNGQGGLTVGNRMVSDDLKPEITKGYEAGIDASLFKSRVNLGITYYDLKTSNQTVETGVSRATGFEKFLVNTGQTSSKGLEASLNVTPFRNANWDISIGSTYAHFNNMVDFLSADLPSLTLGSYTGGAGSYAIPGQPFPVIQGTTHVRDDQGRIIVNPITGYPSSTAGVSVLGAAAAKDILGLNLNVKYKAFSLYANAEYRGGNYIYNSGGTTFDFSGAGINTADYNRERFVIPNSSYLDPATNTYVPNTNITVRDGGPGYWSIAGPRTGIAENYVTSAAFWKIREISLAWNVPTTLLSNTKVIKGARISVQGRNLFVFLPEGNVYTDPEYSAGDALNSGNAIGLTSLGQTPPSRYFGATLSLTL